MSSIGTVCELPTITKFFNGNPTLSSVNSGGRVQRQVRRQAVERHRRDRRAQLGRRTGRGREVLVTPDVDAALSGPAATELEEPAPDEPEELAAALAEEDPDVSVNDASLDYDHDGLPA